LTSCRLSHKDGQSRWPFMSAVKGRRADMSGLRCRPARVRRPLAMPSRGSAETGSDEHIHQRTTKRTGRSLAWLWTAANTVSVTCPTKTSGCNQTRTQRPRFRAKTMHANRLLSTSATFATVLRYPRCCVTPSAIKQCVWKHNVLSAVNSGYLTR